MRSAIAPFLAAALVAASSAKSSAQAVSLTANTKFFSVDSFYYPNADGDYRLYRASGFYEPGSPATGPRVFMLPRIAVDYDGISYYSAGTPVDLRYGIDLSAITSITIPLSYSGALPTEPQSIGVAAQTGGLPQPIYFPDAISDTAGQPMIFAGVAAIPQAVQAIRDAHRQYKTQALATQKANLARWRTYAPEATGINELHLSVLIDGDIVAERRLTGSVVMGGSSLPSIAVKNPSPDVVRRVRDGSFEVQVSYRFRDASVSTVDASFDVAEVIDSYVKETQRAVTTSKSTGMQLFHIGSRRTKVKQSLDQSITRSTDARREAGTVLVMNDADDAQIDRFERTFFPSVSKEQAIAAHLAAADSANRTGKVDLAKVHLEYAKALQQGVALAEVDAVGAAAALNEGDYFTFIAKGVRFMDVSTNTSGTFVRVATENINTSDSRQWTDASKRSVQREVTIVLTREKAIPREPMLGICGLATGPFAGTAMITCVTQGSPLARSGVVNGESVATIDGKQIGTFADLEAIMRTLSPGDKVEIVFVAPNGTQAKRTIKLGEGPPAP